MKKTTAPADLGELLSRGVDKIYPSKEALEKVLSSGKKLRLYQGFDPTGGKLHLGHMIGLRKLAEWQKHGHHVVFLIGDGTGQAGDPSGKTTRREKFFTQEELRENARNYVKQAGKIVRFDGENPVEILYNGDWINKLTIPETLNIYQNFTLAQLADRDLFKEREKRGEEVSMREFIYPMLQAYDSVAMTIDLELGGSDQTFNMLCGRDLVKKMQGREKFVMTTPLLTDQEGRKIGKTEGNVIALTDAPADLYGKIMALPDEIIVKALEYLTDVPLHKVGEASEALAKGENPITYKKMLAREIVSTLHSSKDGEEAEENFSKTFQKREIPGKMEEIEWRSSFVDIFLKAKLSESKSEATRLLKGDAVTDLTENKKVSEKDTPISGHSYRIGKHKFIKIK